ncbi:GDP-mannose 4,6-dehydratase [Planococcus sp. X10-3]|uniref:GDP-mannose 4,6-dehydratase n=1 Tax=Planococcus sp. X10-3 TaxID=3061240 RepID=UPI003BB03284
MKVLVTGGAGFIGSNLTNELIKDHEVVVFDNFSTGKIDNLDSSNNLTVIEGDITDYPFMNKVLADKFDVIYHLAAIASVAASVEDPMYCNEVNFKATLNLLEQIRQNGFETKIVFASSAAVYGDNENLPLSESDAVRPLSPYAIDKYAAEQYVLNYAQLFNIDTCATRFFNVYGPKQDPKSPYSGVISILIDATLDSNKEFSLYGDGSQTRDFVYIDDLVNALTILGDSKEISGKVFNVGTGNSISLTNLIKSIESVSNQKLEINNQPARNGDVKDSRADINRISELGYTTNFSIKDGLLELYKYEFSKLNPAN